MSEKAAFSSKIHQFENGEREKIEREEKERKKALFDKKMSKFDKPDTANNNGSGIPVVKKVSNVQKVAEKFSKEPNSEEVERELLHRREDFDQKCSRFMAEDGDASWKSPEEKEDESRNRLAEMRLMFEDKEAALAKAEEEETQKRLQEEEAEQRRKDFEAKSSLFKETNDSWLFSTSFDFQHLQECLAFEFHMRFLKYVM